MSWALRRKVGPAGTPVLLRSLLRHVGWTLLLSGPACEANTPKESLAPPPVVAPAPSAASLFEASQAAMAKNDLDGAFSAATKCIAADPKHAICHRTLGLLFEHRGDRASACGAFKKYLELEPAAPDRTELDQRLGSCP